MNSYIEHVVSYVMNKREVLIIGGPAGIETFHVSETVSIDVKVEFVQKEEKALMPRGIPYTGVSASPTKDASSADEESFGRNSPEKLCSTSGRGGWEKIGGVGIPSRPPAQRRRLVARLRVVSTRL
jgi:hypothetical protein